MTAISAMIHSLGKLAERVPHGDCDSADQSRGSLAFGAGGSPQAQRGGPHRYLLPSTPRSFFFEWTASAGIYTLSLHELTDQEHGRGALLAGQSVQYRP